MISETATGRESFHAVYVNCQNMFLENDLVKIYFNQLDTIHVVLIQTLVNNHSLRSRLVFAIVDKIF